MFVDLKPTKMYLPSPERKEYTTIELVIACAIGVIMVAIVFGAMNGNTIIPSKQSCLSHGGKWTEGFERGRMTQLCTYN